jgi:subtilisin family serine protease
MLWLGTLIAAGAASLVVGAPATAAPAAAPLAPHVAGRVIVGFHGTSKATQRIGAFNRHGAARHRSLGTKGTFTEVVELPAGVSVEQALSAYGADPSVRFVEPDYVLTHEATANDPDVTSGALWGMEGDASTPANPNGAGAAEAWAAGYTGSSNVVVGVIDEGIQITHPDLAANIWVNPGEIAGNGLDDDANGFVDDVNGWDFFNNDNTVFDGATNAAIDAHGTHVSGTIGGVGGNGVGVAGVNWNVKIVSAKFLGPTGGSTSAAVAAINYLTGLKARYGVNLVAINNSWGGGAFDQAMLDAINAAGDQNILFVAAAGNSGTNNDSAASYPSNYQCTNGGTRGWDCVVAVAAIDSAGGLATFSQFGATTVDVGAPGVGIKSTVPNNTYASYSGTSMATPHVTGAAALCASMNPAISAAAIRNAITSTAAPTASLVGKTVTGGRLDVGAMVQACVPSASGPVAGAPSGLSATPVGSSGASLTWTDGASGENRYDVERALSAGGVCGTYAVVASIAANSVGYTALGLSGGTTYCFRVRALNSFNGGTASSYSNEAVATTSSTPPPFACAGAPYSWVDATVGGASYVLADDASASVALPFPVTLYGDVYTTASISSNGFIRLGSGVATSYVNAAIPTAAEPNALIAPWWDDLNPALGGQIRSLTTGTSPNRRFTVAWVGVPHIAGTTTAVSFEAVISEATGDITFNYLDALTGNTASDRGVGATIGLENGAGTVGTQVSFNTGSRADQTSVRCSTGASAPLAISTTSLPGGSTTSNYSQMVQAVGGRLGYTWSVASGALPPGLALYPTLGVIGGAPTTGGTWSFTMRVTDAAGATATAALSIVVSAPLTIGTASLPSGLVGTPYSATLAATGGTSPYTWSIAAGTLPAGLSLNAATGAITGTPTVAGTSSVTFRVTDSAARTVTKVLSIAITAPALPGAFNKTAPANNATGRSRTALGLSWGASTGATRYEYCVDTINDNVCNTSWISTGTARTVTIGGLGSLTAHYWQVRAVNAVGTTLANAGTWWRFTTAV